MKVNENGILLIKHFESLHDGDLSRVGCQPKMDPVGIWTVGYGHAVVNPQTGKYFRGPLDRDKVYRIYGDMTEVEAEVLLYRDLIAYEDITRRMLTRTLDDDEFSALVSFTYNCGTHYKNKLGVKTPYRIWSLVNQNIAGQAMFDYWKGSVITAGGKILGGLVRRRMSEATLYLYGTLEFYEHAA